MMISLIAMSSSGVHPETTIMRLFFFNTQQPRLKLTARVYSLSIHVQRMIPVHPAPRCRSPPLCALCSL